MFIKKYFLLFSQVLLLHNVAYLSEVPLILIQTFGSPKITGRQLWNNSERGVTIKLAEAIQDALSEQDNKRVFILNESSNQNHLDTINKINQAHQAVLIQLTASKTLKRKPECSIFYRCYNPLTDQIKRPLAPLTPIPYEDVYLINFNQSKILAKSLFNNLENSSDYLDKTTPVGLPLAKIRGIRHPAIQIEVSITKETSLEELGSILCDSITKSLALIPK